MKLLLVIIGCFIAQAVAQSTSPPDMSCTSQDQCKSTECCVHEGFGIGKKRFIFEGSDPFGTDHSHGVCRTRSKMNEHCLPSFLGHDLFNQQLYQSFCPCENGLECRGQTVDEGPHSISHRNPICQTSEK